MHFLKNASGHALGRPRAGVRVRYDRKRKALIVVAEEAIVLVKADAVTAPIPAEVPVLDPEGKPIKASGRFYVTIETIDPFHCVLDIPVS